MNDETENVECPACDWKGHPADLYQTKDGPVCPNCIDEGGHSRCVPVRHASPLSAKGFTAPSKERCLRLAELEGDHTVAAGALPIIPTGIEAMVCADIARRQRGGIKKYGCTVAESPDDMLKHAYEEALDLAVYLRAEMERRGA